MLKETLNRVLDGKTLSTEEAYEVMDLVMKGEVSSEQLASLISLLRFRGETVEELFGFVQGMREHMTTIQHNETVVVDTCGTGGDGQSTFNISTAVAIVLAAMDVKVAKHGNRKVSSASGSADVLELLGVPVNGTPEEAKDMLARNGMTFLYAPTYHSAMRHAGGARRELGFRTMFNMLGPLSNPANSRHQVIGIYDTNLGETLAETLNKLGSQHVLLVTGRDGLDEFSISEPTDVVELKDETIHRYTVAPEEVGLERGKIEDIQVQNPLQSARMIQEIFEGTANKTATNIVTLNAAAGLYVAGETPSIETGVSLVQTALASGTVATYFKKLQQKKGEGLEYASSDS
ncbi:anthranilate phosphoribosyltransferase [Pontibacillus halophilus JSM 076056 = DSM 19796]|uniref:Anthranilate phosphoribosyltransferase n=1 Tax=Pontibacillus halophilus JSM 076056 = DSM 19796 TaxID=1385510 RepID=A0A0A5GRZ3_9BACI|nr:anthranilate phosphoribosyltransferase [Pontibacillus halophilus]KGX93988.1 anthranilate phosphoribosyltransferase [Pontibacillus halophilus JSM 076056 = DSM 19796]